MTKAMALLVPIIFEDEKEKYNKYIPSVCDNDILIFFSPY